MLVNSFKHYLTLQVRSNGLYQPDPLEGLHIQFLSNVHP